MPLAPFVASLLLVARPGAPSSDANMGLGLDADGLNLDPRCTTAELRRSAKLRPTPTLFLLPYTRTLY